MTDVERNMSQFHNSNLNLKKIIKQAVTFHALGRY